MRLTYSRQSRPSAMAIAEEDSNITPVRSRFGDVNWGRYRADTRLNPDISNSTNKRRMRELFAEHDVPMPKLLTRGRSILDFGPRGHEWDYPIIGRPDRHSKKRGFWKCNSFGDVEKAIRGTRRKRAATHFMEYVEADREYRVHVFRGMSIRISEKDFDHEGKYTTVRPRHRVGRVRNAAKQAVEALGLDFGAVDILAKGENNEEVFVLEVNAAPGLGGTTPRLYADAFTRWERGEW